MFDLKNDPSETRNFIEFKLNNFQTKNKAILNKNLIEYEKRWGLKNYVIDQKFKLNIFLN